MRRIATILLVLITSTTLFGGTTGKIRGTVTDSEGSPLVGANIVLEGTLSGAASDLEGAFFILNVNPGIYSARVSMIGYKTLVLSNIQVQTDYSTTLEAVLEISAIQGDEVVVSVRRSLLKKDATASAAIITSQVLENAPIETFQEIVQTKAGVTVDSDGKLHFRGGRSNEILYLTDGIPNVNPFNSGIGIDISTNAIQELSVITGSFSAEYGQAMSGVINIITKEGRPEYHGSVSYMGGDMLTDYDIDISPIVQDKVQPYEFGFNNELEASLSGPVIPGMDNLLFHASVRRNHDGGHLYGISRYTPYGVELDSSDWKSFVMNPTDQLSIATKLSYRLSSNVKLQWTYVSEDSLATSYSHTRKYIEEGHRQAHKEANSHMVKLTQQLSQFNFYDISYSLIRNDFTNFAYDSPTDSRYVAGDYAVTDANYEFTVGGTNNDRTLRNLKTQMLRFNYTQQLNRRHELKSGFELKYHDIDARETTMVADKRDEPFTDENGNSLYDSGELFTDLDGDGFWSAGDDENGDGIVGNIIEDQGVRTTEIHANPEEYSVYLLDKIEMDDIVINIGIRWDYFNSGGQIATDWSNPSSDSKTDVSAKQQFSPRFSMAFPVSDRGKMFFSYGHFFQMPPYYRLYQNPDFKIRAGLINSDVGNADLEPQKTISYEIGFEHEVGSNSALFVKLFYRDIHDLLGQRVYIMPDSREYTLFINRAWGNTKGFTFSFEQQMTGLISGSVDYTFMVARGNESNPTRTRRNYRLKVEQQKKVIYLDWDQPHAFRFNLNIAQPNNWSFTAIGRIETGYPYTPSDANALIRIADENSGRKPSRVNLDLTAFKHFRFDAGTRNMKLTLFAKVYNLLDIRNEDKVFDNSGSAWYSLGRYGGASTPEYINRSNYFSKPRRLNLGITVSF